MENVHPRIQHFFEEVTDLLQRLTPQSAALWGKLTPQGAVEHLEDSLNTVISGNMDHFFPENQAALIQFIHGPKPFRENTRHPLLPENPIPLRNKSLEEAINKLSQAMVAYLKERNLHPERTPVHPGFGALSFETWDALLIKHFTHHLQQFSLLPR